MKYTLKPRTRAVKFRVTDEEYEALRTGYSAQNARSVSDFARGAALRQAAGGGEIPDREVSVRLRNIEASLNNLWTAFQERRKEDAR